MRAAAVAESEMAYGQLKWFAGEARVNRRSVTLR